MERRLNIFEKIKLTKLNKLTIKQGDVNVSLNLKKDLIDPSVEISDKVLEMLENYAQKNVKQPVELPEPSRPNSPLNLCQSPTKRVRFDLNSLEHKNFHESSIKIASSITSIPVPPQPEPEPQTLEIPEIVQEEGLEPGKDEPKKTYNCRLCKLKFSNEKSLHEHVARIHGGKGAFNQHFLANLTTDGEYEDSTDLEEDLDSQDEAYMSSSSEKVKLQPPRPNIAIRVAKVAYYNSKGTVNSNNPFKSNIFKNGGVRGNFFSQERLPLRSCKIKMKITSNLDTFKDKNQNDEFLINSHEILSTEKIDSNKTLSVQSSTLQSSSSDQSLNNMILSDTEMKMFFKSLLDYIPINTVTRVDDLIKSSEGYLSSLGKSDTAKYLRVLHESVLNSKQFGLSLYEIKTELKDIKMSLLKKMLCLLVENHLILPVGVVERVYVAHEFKQHWVIESYKNQRGRGYYEDEQEEESVINDDEQEMEINDDEQRPRRHALASKETSASTNSKNFKPVCLIPRPWRYIDGLLNRPVLKKMLESILLYLKTYPNSSLNSISSHFCPVLQPIMTLELLEMLERLKCIRKIILKKEQDCDLFSDFNNGSCLIESEDDMDGNELFMYYLNQSSIFTFRKIFP